MENSKMSKATYAQVSKSISNLFADLSYSPQETLDMLRRLQVEIEDYISALQVDLDKEEI
jgi:hypothetical protein